MKTELPKNWKSTPLGDVCKTLKGKKPKNSGEISKNRTIPYINIKAFETGLPVEYAESGNYPECSKGDVLIVWDGARSGLTGRGVAGYVGSTLSKIWSDIVDNGYLYYFLQSQYDFINTNTKGVGIPHVDPNILFTIDFSIAPKGEQNRIVAEIEKQFSRLDEAVENLKRVKANLERYKASVLKAAVEGKLTEEWRKNHPDVEPADKLLERILAERRKKWEETELAKMKKAGKVPKDDKWKKKYGDPSTLNQKNLVKLPHGWLWASVDQLAEIRLGKMLDRQKHRKGNKLSYLRNINVRWGTINTDDLLEMFFKDTELDRYSLMPGDVLVCEGGEPGRAAVWDGSLSDMKYQKALHRVRFYRDYEEQLLVYYLEFLSQTGRLKRWFTGSTIKHFTKESFSGLPIPVPPKAEQVEIISVTEEHFSKILVLERDVEINLIRSDRLRQSILKKAFSGKLVPQGNNDESTDIPLKQSA
ncbi:MAG: restriction endonuclease subunit S [Desulfobacterales bacterium]|nr:restriction endonuclease subunit S [Desulfobacterales bacterium]